MERGCRYPIRRFPAVLDLSKLCSTVSPGMIEPSVWGDPDEGGEEESERPGLFLGPTHDALH